MPLWKNLKEVTIRNNRKEKFSIKSIIKNDIRSITSEQNSYGDINNVN